VKEEKEPMPSTRRVYTEEERAQVVDLLLSSGRPLKQVARELGITPYTLRGWRDRRIGKPAGATEVPTAESPEQELKRLRREVAYLQRQREILKKAMSILGEDPHLGMR
jgi:transposase